MVRLHASRQLLARGVATVLWVRPPPSIDDPHLLIFHIISPVLDRAMCGADCETIEADLLSRGRQLFGAGWSTAGCVGSAVAAFPEDGNTELGRPASSDDSVTLADEDDIDIDSLPACSRALLPPLPAILSDLALLSPTFPQSSL